MADTSSNSCYTSCMERLKSYVMTKKGAILAGEIILTLIVVICQAVTVFVVYPAIAISEMIIAIIFFGIFMMELDKKFPITNWIDFVRAISGAAVLIIMSLVNLIKWSGDGAWQAAGVFGLIAGLLFTCDTVFIYLHIKDTRQNPSASTGNV